MWESCVTTIFIHERSLQGRKSLQCSTVVCGTPEWKFVIGPYGYHCWEWTGSCVNFLMPYNCRLILYTQTNVSHQQGDTCHQVVLLKHIANWVSALFRKLRIGK